MLIQLLICIEVIKQQGFVEFLKETFHFNREIVVTYKNLEEDLNYDKYVMNNNYKFLELSKQNIDDYDLNFTMKSRQMKANSLVEQGYHCFCLVDGNNVLGDIWYFSYDNNYARDNHRDLDYLRITLQPKEAYMFDMHVLKDKRGGDLVKILLANALLELKENECAKVYGYYVSNNIPALWVHRIFGYKEIMKYKTNRFLFYRASQSI